MECPYCNSELNHTDSYGSGRRESFHGTAANGIYYPCTYEHLGDIYSCPNSNGFETEEETNNFLKEIGETLESIRVDTWEEVSCSSFENNGHFYTDKQNDLHDGYPC